MRPLLKLLLLITAGAIAIRVSSRIISKQSEEGTEVSDEFRRMVCLDTLDFSSRAGGLRSAEISVVLGGAKVDLRDAVIDPAGARVLAENTLGGLQLIVRDDWAVTVSETLVGGGEIGIQVTPADELPEDAPKLEIDVITRLGGTMITTGSDEA